MYKKSILFIAFLMMSCVGVFALSDEDVCAEAVVTDINPSSIEIDEEFTVGVSIESCGSRVPDEVRFEIVQPSPDLVIKEPLVLDIGRLHYANSNRFVTYHMRTTPNATPGTYLIETRLTYRGGDLWFTKNGTISVTVTSDEAQLALAALKTTPLFPVANEPVTITLRLENFGKGDANSIKAELIGLTEFTGSKKAFLGELAADDDGILSFNLVPKKAGDYSYEVAIGYRDDFGSHDYREKLQIVVDPAPNNLRTILFVVVIVAGIALFFFRRTRARVHQAKAVEQLQRRGH